MMNYRKISSLFLMVILILIFSACTKRVVIPGDDEVDSGDVSIPEEDPINKPDDVETQFLPRKIQSKTSMAVGQNQYITKTDTMFSYEDGFLKTMVQESQIQAVNINEVFPKSIINYSFEYYNGRVDKIIAVQKENGAEVATNTTVYMYEDGRVVSHGVKTECVGKTGRPIDWVYVVSDREEGERVHWGMTNVDEDVMGSRASMAEYNSDGLPLIAKTCEADFAGRFVSCTDLIMSFEYGDDGIVKIVRGLEDTFNFSYDENGFPVKLLSDYGNVKALNISEDGLLIKEKGHTSRHVTYGNVKSTLEIHTEIDYEYVELEEMPAMPPLYDLGFGGNASLFFANRPDLIFGKDKNITFIGGVRLVPSARCNTDIVEQ